MKKIITGILALTLAVSLFSPAAMAASLSDLPRSHIALLEDTSEAGGISEGGGSGETPNPGGSGEVPEPGATPDHTTPPTTPSETTPSEPSTEPSQPSTEPTEQPTEPSVPPTEPDIPTTPPTIPTNPPVNPPIYTGIPSVTKQPTGENVKEGGYAEFVARADNCTDIIWHLKNPGGSIDILAKDAWEHFPGVVATGLNSERLGLDHIPKELNEWRVLAEFVGRDGNVWSEPAVINVMSHKLQAPTVQKNPADANLKFGEQTTLQVVAQTTEANTTLTYQWYKNTINSNVGGRSILGATESTFTPNYEAGTTYYYCLVRSSDGSENSAATKSSCAAVTYAVQETTATTAPSAAGNPTDAADATVTPWIPGTSETNPTAAPDLESTAPDELPNVPGGPARSHALLYIVIAVIAVIAVLGTVAAIVIIKLYPKEPAPKAPPKPKRPPQKQQQAPASPFDTPEGDDQWDDLSDLGDLSFYLGDDSDNHENKF